MIPRPPIDLPHAPQVPDPGHVVLHHPGDQQLSLLNRGPRQDHLFPVPWLDGGDQGVLGGHGVSRLPLADDLRRGDPLPDLDVSPASPDVDRDVAQFRYLQQDIVAQLGGIHGKPVCSEPHPELVQRPQDLLLGHRLIPLDLEVPYKEGPHKQRRRADPQRDPQPVPVPDAPQKKGRALPAHRRHVAVDAPAQPPQPLPIPPGHGEGEGHLGLPAEIPEHDAVFRAEVQHPFREAALHPPRDLALQQIHQMLQHITSPTPAGRCSPVSAAGPQSCWSAPDPSRRSGRCPPPR